jgi:hypothetical protein
VNAYRYDNHVARPLRGMFKLLTPLHVACARQNMPVARVLLQYGADPHRMALEAGQLVPPTALESARATKNQELLDLLVQGDNLKILSSSTTFQFGVCIVMAATFYIFYSFIS